MTRLAPTLAVSVVALLTATQVAHAQNALGGGNALDRDLTMRQRHGQHAGALDANSQVGAGRVNATAAKTDFFSRNLIVTGDVAGGRGFRGSVGYKEQSEFTGQTGSDANRRWDAYSVMSSPMAIRSGIDPYKATQEYGAIMYTREYSNAAARDILTDQQPLDSRLAFDRFTAAGMKMSRQADIIDAANTRDTSSRIDTRLEGKIPLGGPPPGAAAAGANDLAPTNNSMSSGVPVDAMLAKLGLSTYERQRLKHDVLSGRTNMNQVGQVYDEDAMLIGNTLSDSQRVNPVLPAEYSSVIDTLRQRAGIEPRKMGATDQPKAGNLPGSTLPGDTKPGDTPASTQPSSSQPSTLPGATPGAANSSPLAPPSRQLTPQEQDFDQQMDWLRYQLSRSGPDGERAGRARPSEDTKPSTAGGAEVADDGTGEVQPLTEKTKGGIARTEDGSIKVKQRSVEEMALILKHGKRMESLVPEDAGYIKDMMQLGAESMRKGDFFRAEERFGSVLRVIPGHPVALAGVANAELGAGLSLSAALTLRKTFAANPEMIGTRFGPEVLPEAERLESGLKTARMRLSAASSADAGPHLAADRFDYGLLIAYIGFQQDRMDVVREGLAAMQKSRADDPLVKVLQRVWLPDGEMPVQPLSTAPSESAPAAPSAPAASAAAEPTIKPPPASPPASEPQPAQPPAP